MRDMRDLKPSLRDGSDRKLVIAISVAVLLLGAAIAAFWFWKQSQHRPSPTVAEQIPAPTTAEPSTRPVSIAEGDNLLRQLGSQLSSSPALAKWLAETDILRRLVAAVNLIADGSSPRAVVGFLAPAGKFEVRTENRRLYPSPKSYSRYDAVTRTLTSIDPVAAGKAYATLKRYIDAVFAEIGRPNRSFDAVFHQAIDRLTSTPITNESPELKEGVLVYVYADPKLESLSAAQKHLLRMGPINGLAIQRWLKHLDEALPKSPPQN
jgi:hypothetical protein